MSAAGSVLVTGANSGIGRVTAGQLARRGARVLLACRTLEKAEATVAGLRAEHGEGLMVEPLALDLADLADVRRVSADIVGRKIALSGLINNAGLAGQRALSRDGFELSFAVNHLGHFLLTRLLEEPLRRGAPARVVNVSSEAHRRVGGIDFEGLRRPAAWYNPVLAYCASKLCNILFSRELARRWAGTGITTYALHPGVVATGIWRRIPQPLRWFVINTRFMLSPDEGARTTLYCATAPELAGVSGRYYNGESEATPSPAAQDDALALRLWQVSEKLAGLV